MTVLQCQTVANQPTRQLRNRSTDDLSALLRAAVGATWRLYAHCGGLLAHTLWAGCWHTHCMGGLLAHSLWAGCCCNGRGCIASELEASKVSGKQLAL